RFVSVESPSCPSVFAPQHCTEPSPAIAHACDSPAASAVTSDDRPTTSTGDALSVVPPSPSSPLLPTPQHFTAPIIVTAQLNPFPATTERAGGKPTTCTGT